VPRALTSGEYDEFRDRLCRVAMRLVLGRGIDGFSMRTLAKEVGCSPMRAYHYFQSKEDLIAAIKMQAFDRFAAALEQARAGESDPISAARATNEAYTRFAADNPSAYRLMFETGPTNAEGYPELARASARARATMTAGAVALKQAGLLDGDPDEIGKMFWAALHGLTILNLSGQLEAKDPADMRLKMTRALYRGLNGRGADSIELARSGGSADDRGLGRVKRAKARRPKRPGRRAS
jgi:AcrR family transcriptional regulator